MNIIQHIKDYVITFLENCGLFIGQFDKCSGLQCLTDEFFIYFTPYITDLAFFLTYLLILWAVLACLRSAMLHMVNNPKKIKGTVLPFIMILLTFLISIGLSSSHMPNEYVDILPTIKTIKKFQNDFENNKAKDKWIISDTDIRKTEFANKKYGYGLAMKKYCPKCFEDEIKELSSFDKFIEPFINAEAPAAPYKEIAKKKNPTLYKGISARTTQISGGALITFYVLSLITICIILYSTITSKLFRK